LGPYVITGFYSDANCVQQLPQESGYWFGELTYTVVLGACVQNAAGIPSVLTCEAPGVIREVNYEGGTCDTTPTLNHTIKQGACNPHKPGSYFKADWSSGCSAYSAHGQQTYGGSLVRKPMQKSKIQESEILGPYVITGFYSDANCVQQLPQESGYWFGELTYTVVLGACVQNAAGIPSVLTCEAPGVIREVNYEGGTCDTTPTLNHTIKQGACNPHKPGSYFKADWSSGCSA